MAISHNKYLVLLCCLLSGCSAKTIDADSVYINGKVYTLDASTPWVQAIAVSGDRIVATGTTENVLAHAGEQTKVSDLQGRMVMPGIHDAHTHFLLAGLKETSPCELPAGASPEIMVDTLKKCSEGQAEEAWVTAGSYYFDQFENGKPDRAALDTAFPNTPVYLEEFSAHHGLANSKALEIAGLNRDTPDPPGGSLPKNASGELSGELVETATWLVTQHIPALPAQKNASVVSWASKKASEFGITSVQEAAANREALQAFKEVDDQGQLQQRVAAHVILKSSQFGNASFADLETLLTERALFQSEHVFVDFAKMWVDGSPTPPYFTEAGFDEAQNAIQEKNLLVPEDDLITTVVRLDKAGIKAKLHVAGAGAAHAALNAIAAAREANPKSQIMHELGHTNLVIPADLKRFKVLNAVAELSPSVWHLYGLELGSPPRPSWQFQSLSKAGALLTIGTDWPVTSDPNLFPALEGMLDRGAESIELDEAIRAMTINGAVALDWDDDLGSIAAGKIASFIVLDRNLFDIDTAEISETKVVQTIFEGKTVFAREL